MDYKSCALSAVRAKIAYLDSDSVNQLWHNTQTVGNTGNIAYHIFKDVAVEPKYYYDSVSSVNAYSWIQEKTLYIVFRGTEGYDDVKIDLMQLRTPLFAGNKNIMVHSGFYKQFRSIQDDIMDTIVACKNSVDCVNFNGHSLGAALATLAAGYFSPLIRDMSGCKIVCHTIGCPRIGNTGFVNWWTGKVDESCRILNCWDPVPLLPVNGFYKHINGGLQINHKCEVKFLVSDLPWYRRLINLPQNIYCKNPIVNHGCDVYIERLLKLAKWDLNRSN